MEPIVLFVFDGEVTWIAPDTPRRRIRTVAYMAEDACEDQWERDLDRYEDGDVIALLSYDPDEEIGTITWEADSPSGAYSLI